MLLPLQRRAPKAGFRNPFSMMVGFCNLSGFNQFGLIMVHHPTYNVWTSEFGSWIFHFRFLISDLGSRCLILHFWIVELGFLILDVWFGSCESSPPEKQNRQLSLLDPKTLWMFFLDLYWIFDYLQNLYKMSKGLRWSNLHHGPPTIWDPSRASPVGIPSKTPSSRGYIYIIYITYIWDIYEIHELNKRKWIMYTHSLSFMQTIR